MPDPTAKPAIRRIVRVAAVAYVVATLPFAVLFVWSPHYRSVSLDLVSHYRAKLDPVRSVHIGDSITAGGGAYWSVRIFGTPLDSVNLAGNGYTVAQIKHQVAKALAYEPEYICVMGGTNDLFDPRYDIEFTVDSYESLITEIRDAGVTCVVTLVPHRAVADKQEEIDLLNLRIATVAKTHDCTVIDLNPVVAPDKILLPGYTTDGTHFTDAAYIAWSDMINRAINRKNSNGE
jgi:lysophospholipase L1-like esterase